MEEKEQPPLEQDTNELAELGLDQLGTPQDTEPEQTPIINKDRINMEGSEQLSMEFNGVKITLGSFCIGVDGLCSLALWFYDNLKKNSQEKGGNSYVG